jgi:hypothetical protein
MGTITKKFTLVEATDASPIRLANIDPIRRPNVLNISGPSPASGSARQSYTPGVGGTLTALVPGYGYEVVSKGVAVDWDLPGVRVLYGDDVALPPNLEIGVASMPSCIAITLQQLRATTLDRPDITYWMLDRGKEGMWVIDLADTTSADDTGMTVVGASGLRFKRAFTGPAYATWFDILPNDKSRMASNSVVLNTLIVNNPFLYLFFNGPGSNYYIGASPFNRTGSENERHCISLVDFQGKLEGDSLVTLTTQTAHTGIFCMRTVDETNFRLENLNIVHDGGRDAEADHGCVGYRNRTTGILEVNRPADLTNYRRVYTDDWGAYKHNGIDMWGTARLRDISISGFPGHGICVFGTTQIHVSGPNIPMSGTFGTWNGDLTFSFDDPTTIDRLGLGPYGGWTVVVNGNTHRIGGVGQGIITIGYLSNAAANEVVGEHATGYLYRAGKTLFADSIVMDGKNECSGNGGCGIFTTSDEANQSFFSNVRVGNNGGWGVCDSSLLKNEFHNLHCTANGEHFNDFSVNPAVRVVGGFTNRGDNNAGSTLSGHQYREGGDEGQDQASAGTVYAAGGVFPEGIPQSGYGLVNNWLFGVRGVKIHSPNGTGWNVTVTDQGTLEVARA